MEDMNHDLLLRKAQRPQETKSTVRTRALVKTPLGGPEPTEMRTQRQSALPGSGGLTVCEQSLLFFLYLAWFLDYYRAAPGGGGMGFRQRLEEVREGFARPFWVANISEIFERLSYYGAAASMPLYLHEKLNFSTQRADALSGWFGGMVWFLAIFGGAVADKIGFRRALSTAYLILATAYFLIGSIADSWLAPVRSAVPLTLFAVVILMLPALGISMVKPCVVGTTARASKENVRQIGYSIYYTMVNIGSFGGPYMASWAHAHLGVERVFRISALSVLVMFFFVLIFFREPHKADGARPPSLLQVGKNFLAILWPPRFLIFLLLFTGYWIVYWQQYTTLPGYITNYVNANKGVAELILVTDPLVVIFLTIAVNQLIKKMAPLRAVILGTVITSVSWLILAFWPTVPGTVVSLVVLAIGEIIQQPPYYSYISKLAPAGQQGTYMGFAFLPLGLGSIFGGMFGGYLVHHYAEVLHRQQWVWYAITAVGLATAALLLVYDWAIRPKEVA
jgi:proton-dependent oligopeptide transporter, POT family